MIGFDKDPRDAKPLYDAIRDMWAETGLDTDAVDVETIVDWFDSRRGVGQKLDDAAEVRWLIENSHPEADWESDDELEAYCARRAAFLKKIGSNHG